MSSEQRPFRGQSSWAVRPDQTVLISDAMKTRAEKQSLSESKLKQSLRHGHHATVYEIRRDPQLKNKDVIRDRNEVVFPFIGGTQYKGQWNADRKEGFGIQINPDNTKYEGEWANNMCNGRGTLWVKKGREYTRQYVGDWVDGRMEGQGVYYYDKGEIYKGEWIDGERSGSGRYEYANGDVYVGEWRFHKPHGLGTFNYINGNIFEGIFVEGKKEGPGLHYYASTVKVYQGEWSDDQPRCGEFRSPTRAEELKFVRPLPRGLFHNNFALPGIGLSDPQSVLDSAISATRMRSVEKTLTRPETPFISIDEHDMERAKQRFAVLSGSTGTIPVASIADVLSEMGLFLDSKDVEELRQSLEVKDGLGLTFADIVEIATFIQAEYQPRALEPAHSPEIMEFR